MTEGRKSREGGSKIFFKKIFQSLTLLVGMQIGAATMENSMEGLKKLKMPYDPANLLLSTYTKKTKMLL